MNTFLFFILGTLVGSFLNVVILRYKTGLSFADDRSRCLSCGKKLEWYELIPILSFVFLRGKCAGCQSKISFQYPVVELASGFLFSALFAKFIDQDFGLSLLVIHLFIFSTLLVITVYDLRHKIIPNQFVGIFISAAVVVAVFHFFNDLSPMTIYPRLISLFAGPILFLPFYFLWKFSDGKWIGLGDGKLVVGIGTLLGLPEGLSAVVISFWVGAVFALLVLFSKKILRGGHLWKRVGSLTMKSEIPFAPFLILGTVIVFFFPLDIFSLHLFGL